MLVITILHEFIDTEIVNHLLALCNTPSPNGDQPSRVLHFTSGIGAFFPIPVFGLGNRGALALGAEQLQVCWCRVRLTVKQIS